MGAFVLPNAVISDEAPLESFVTPGTYISRLHIRVRIPTLALSCLSFKSNSETPSIVDAVERAAGLTLFSDAIKASSKHLCKTASCQLIVRKFDDAGRLLYEGPAGGNASAVDKRKGIIASSDK
jgi:endonuclease G